MQILKTSKFNTAFALIFLCIGFIETNAQTIFGINNYTTYQIGSLPIVISAPHGGELMPQNIPDRTCNNPNFAFDIYTIELAKQIDSSLFKITSLRPHIILCNLKRPKVDCNRNIADGACGNIEAEQAWNEFHHFIDTAENISKNQYNGKAFYIDLHGHGHTEQNLELGYLLSVEELTLSDSILNTSKYINYSSIQNLVKTNISNYTHSELLRGSYSLGTLLGNAGYPSVPSQQIPSPASNPYFSGGYNTANYTSYFPNETSDGLQIEANFVNVRDTHNNRKIFADSIASVLVKYFAINYNIDIINHQPLGINETSNSNAWKIFPTNIVGNQKIKLTSNITEKFTFTFCNTLGQVLERGILDEEKSFSLTSQYNSGIYFIAIKNMVNQKTFRIQLIN